MLGDHERELEVARRARDLFPDKRAELPALAALGRIEELNARLQEPREMAQASRELRVHGYGDAATEMLQRAIGWFEDRSPEQKIDLKERWTLATVLLDLGRLDEAQVVLEGLLEDGQLKNDYLTELGVIAAWRGEREEALRISRLVEEGYRSLNLPGSAAGSAYDRGKIAAALGERERATEMLRRSGHVLHTWGHGDPALERLWDYPPFQELIRPKG